MYRVAIDKIPAEEVDRLLRSHPNFTQKTPFYYFFGRIQEAKFPVPKTFCNIAENYLYITNTRTNQTNNIIEVLIQILEERFGKLQIEEAR